MNLKVPRIKSFHGAVARASIRLQDGVEDLLFKLHGILSGLMWKVGPKGFSKDLGAGIWLTYDMCIDDSKSEQVSFVFKKVDTKIGDKIIPFTEIESINFQMYPLVLYDPDTQKVSDVKHLRQREDGACEVKFSHTECKNDLPEDFVLPCNLEGWHYYLINVSDEQVAESRK